MKKCLSLSRYCPGRFILAIMALIPMLAMAGTVVPTAATAPIPGTITLDNIKEYNGCQIYADPLFDYANSDDGYILFNVNPTVTGRYTFTANISTGLGKSRYCTLGPVDANGQYFPEVAEKEIPAGIDCCDWTKSKSNYSWDYNLMAGTTYTIKVSYNRNGESFGVNLYSIHVSTTASSDYSVTYFNEAYSTAGASYTVFTTQPYKQGATLNLPTSLPAPPGGMMFDYWAKADGTKVKTGDAASTMSLYPVWVKSMIAIGPTGVNVTVANVREWSNCVAKGSQLIDMARNGSYILFDVRALASGYYTFTSNIATSLNDIRCALGYINKQGVFVKADTIAIANSGSWTTTKTYKWNFYFDADTTYTYKMMCFAGSGYALNAFSISIAPFTSDVALSSASVNGFLVVPESDQLTTEAYSGSDLTVTAKPHSSTGKLSYTAKCNGNDIAISQDGVISKSLFKTSDVVRVYATITDGPVSSNPFLITINITDKQKKQIRGKTVNDGYWTNVTSSSVQCWTDYIYTLTPSESTTRLSNGSWTLNGSTLYGFYSNASSVAMTIPSNYKISSVSFIGYGNATFGLASDGATVTSPAVASFDASSSANIPDEVAFKLTNHVAGTPLNFTVSNTDCRFYIVFSYEELADTKAPVLVAQNLKNNDVLTNINGYISLRFDEAVKLSSTASATLNGQNAKLKIENNVFVSHFFYGLAYESTHTFVLKANSVEDMSGNKNAADITITFSTGKKAVVTKKAFDFVVGVNGTIDEAIKAAHAASGSSRYYIFVPNGSYELSGNDGDHMTSINRNNLSITGQSKEGAIITNTPVSYGISTTATIHLKSASNTYMQDITIKNNRGEANQGQQVAVFDRSSKNIFKNVKIFSFQDTYVSGDRAYWDECDIYGSTDYICGGGNVFFNKCLLYNRAASGSKITAPATDLTQKWGYVFSNCTIDGGDFVLGRPWQNEPRSYFLNTKMNKQPAGTGWEGMGGLVTHFYEYKSMDSKGNLLDLSGRGNSPTSTNSYKPVLTDEEAAEFTLYNVLSGTDGWVPSDYTVQSKAPSVSVSGRTMSWINDADALCTVIFKDGVYMACTIENQIELPADGTYTVQAANEMGGLGAATTLTVTGTGVESLNLNKVTKNGHPKGIYDLMGRRLNQIPEKGFYIKDGVKYFKN